MAIAGTCLAQLWTILLLYHAPVMIVILGTASGAFREVFRDVQTLPKTSAAEHVILTEILHDLQSEVNMVEKEKAKLDEVMHNVQSLSKEIEEEDAELLEASQVKVPAMDWRQFRPVGVSRDRVYLVSKERVPFEYIGLANEACQVAGGYLLEIDDDEEFHTVYDFLDGSRNDTRFWTGGNDIDREGMFVYFNSQKPVPELSSWVMFQPDNWEGNEDCMEIRLDFDGLNDRICTAAEKFVCELPLKWYQYFRPGYFRDHFYLSSYTNEIFNIRQANDACLAAGGYLLEIDDDEEYYVVYDFLKKLGESYDMYRYGTFFYFNSMRPAPKLSVWAENQPDDWQGREHCMEIRVDLGGLYDIFCDEVDKIVCEIPLKLPH